MIRHDLFAQGFQKVKVKTLNRMENLVHSLNTHKTSALSTWFWLYLQKTKTILCSFYKDQLQCRPYGQKLILILLLTVLIQEPGVETEATAPSTTAGPVLVEVPEPLVPAPPEFLCTWGGMRVEFSEGLTESSVKRIWRKIYNTHN